MYTIGAFRKKNDVNEEVEVKVEENPHLVEEWPSLVEEFTKTEPVIKLVSQKKDWIILTKNNIIEDEKPEDIKKNELLRVIRHNDREIILKKAYSEYMRDNEDYMLNIYEKITTMNPIYFDKLRSSERGFIIFSRFIFSKYIFDKNNLKKSRNL
jgi:hypothetical protein